MTEEKICNRCKRPEHIVKGMIPFDDTHLCKPCHKLIYSRYDKK